MPLIYSDQPEENQTIGIWKIEEPPDFFLEKLIFSDWETSYFRRIKHPNRQASWLSSRYLIKILLETDVFVELLFDTNGKPILNHQGWRLSISHTHEYAAVYLAKDREVGLDIESSTRSVAPISHKFLSQEEWKMLDNDQLDTHLLLHWGAKETMYKIYGRKLLDFREHMFVEPFKPQKSGVIHGYINKHQKINCTMNYKVQDGYSLVTGFPDDSKA